MRQSWRKYSEDQSRAVSLSFSAFLAYAVFFPMAVTNIVSIFDDASPRQTTKNTFLPTDSAYKNNQNAADNMGLNDSVQPSC